MDKNKHQYSLQLLLLLCVGVYPMQAQIFQKGETRKVLITDSAKTKSSDSVVVHDSLSIRFIPGMGKLTRETDSNDVLFRNQVLWSDAKYLGDAFWKVPGFFLRQLGEDGKEEQLQAYGVDGRAISILLDGRPMNDPVTGTYNFYDMPLEFLDHVEIFRGQDAGASSTDAAINFVTRSYNSYRPMTKIRYVQDPSKTLLTDVLFTQNIARGMNLMIAFDRSVSDGNYRNAIYDAWNFRTRIRYNISNRINISLMDFYTKTSDGQNYGIVSPQQYDIFEPLNALVERETSFENRTRRDMTFSTFARLLSDSTSLSQFNIFYTTSEREFRAPPTDYNDNIRQLTSASFYGFNLRQNISLSLLHCVAGTQWEKVHIDSTVILPLMNETSTTYYFSMSMNVSSIFYPEFSVHQENRRGKDLTLREVGGKCYATDWLTLFASRSWYDRLPTIQEQFLIDSTIQRRAPLKIEKHSFLHGGLTVKPDENVSITLEAFQRDISNAIVFRPSQSAYGTPAIDIANVGTMAVKGIVGNIRWKWKSFEIYGNMTLTQYKEVDTTKLFIPDIIFSGELTYRNLFFHNALDVKFGIRSTFYNHENGMKFNPQYLLFSENRSFILGYTTIMDLFAVAEIGSAYVSLTWANILNAHYIMSPIYPMPGSHVRFGVHWVFID